MGSTQTGISSKCEALDMGMDILVSCRTSSNYRGRPSSNPFPRLSESRASQTAALN